PVSTPFGASFVALRLPKEFPDLNYSVLSFGYDDRLIRITAIGNEIKEDGDGRQLRARYGELRQLLEKVYGPGKEEEHVEHGLEGSQYSRGLQEKKNWLFTIYSPPDVNVELSTLAEFQTTRWRLILEYTPGLRQVEAEQRRREKEALGAAP